MAATGYTVNLHATDMPMTALNGTARGKKMFVATGTAGEAAGSYFNISTYIPNATVDCVFNNGQQSANAGVVIAGTTYVPVGTTGAWGVAGILSY